MGDGLDALNEDAAAIGKTYLVVGSDLLSVTRRCREAGYNEHQTRAMLFLNHVPAVLADGAIAETFGEHPSEYPESPLASRRVPDERKEAEVPTRWAIETLADTVNQLAMMLEDALYAHATGLRNDVPVFVQQQKRLRRMRERVAPLIEP